MCIIRKINLDNATAISTAIIACIAMFFSIWQGCETRNHNKLSVKPFLEIGISVSENEPLMGVWLENNGVGPAIMKEFIIYFDGQPTNANNFEAMKKVYQDAKIYSKGISFSLFTKNTVLIQGGRTDIISYIKENQTAEGIEKFKEGFSHLRFKVIYESIYNVEFETSTLEEQ